MNLQPASLFLRLVEARKVSSVSLSETPSVHINTTLRTLLPDIHLPNSHVGQFLTGYIYTTPTNNFSSTVQ